MQILAFYNAVANNGKLMKPSFIEKTSFFTKTVLVSPSMEKTKTAFRDIDVYPRNLMDVMIPGGDEDWILLLSWATA